MLKIRLMRFGKRDQPSFRIVVIPAKTKRQSKAIEFIGYYNPISKELKLDEARAKYWLSVGAQPSDTVYGILVKHKLAKERPRPKRKPKEAKKKKETVETPKAPKAEQKPEAKDEKQAAEVKADQKAKEKSKEQPVEKEEVKEEIKEEKTTKEIKTEDKKTMKQ